jgi:hypothetical protein
VRAAQRALRKLESQHLVAVLPRRVGGYGGGAAQSVWHLTEAGRRLLRHRPGSSGSSGSLAASGEGWRRVRFSEPSPQFLAHTLRVADICLVLEQLGAASGGELGLAAVQTEPECWRVFTGPYGALSALRPDLYAEVASLEFLDCWFIEADMATEHLPAIVRKARVYEAYRALGREQAVRGVFPLVLWVTPDGRRAEAIMRAIGQDSVCDVRAHQAVAMAGLAARLADPRPG